MSDELDLQQLGQIPDPFAVPGDAPSPPRPAPTGAGPSRPQLRRRRTIAASAALAYEVLWVVLVEHRRDLGSLPAWTIALGLVVPLAAAVLALGVVTGKGRRGLGAPVVWLAALSVLPVVLFAVATVATSPADTETARFWDLAGRCIGITALLTAGPLALGGWVFQHAFAAASVWRTAALGVGCGALAAATMSLACWHAGALHVVVGHGAMIVVGGAAGALLGRRLTRA
jgi:hypothetical protein